MCKQNKVGFVFPLEAWSLYTGKYKPEVWLGWGVAEDEGEKEWEEQSNMVLSSTHELGQHIVEIF